ncbi:MAG: hypothetical protein NDJ89_16150 [Oligoflexia bacterium]|nr:hypothetical protein [Oligoflexia bacterium]
MPSVTPPSDGGYQYYQKTLNELEEELQAESRRSRERQAEQARKLEEAHQASLAKYREETDETVENIRRNANETIEQDRLYAKNEIDKIKAQTYDKFGRYNGLEADALKGQFDELQRASEEQRRKDRLDLSASEQRHEQRLEDAREEYDAKLERSVRAARDSAQQTYSTAYQGQVNEYAHFKDEAEKKYHEMIRAHQEELQTERRMMQNALNQERRNYERKLETAQQTNESRLGDLEHAYSEKMKDGTRTLAESRQQETAQLRGQLNELGETQKRYQKEKGQGTLDAVAEYDSEWRAKLRSANEDFSRQLDRQKDQSKADEKYFANLGKEVLREKDAYFTDLITRVNRENHADKKELESTLIRDRKQMELEQKRDREASRQTMETQLHEANVQRDKALKEQAKAYQQTIERQRLADQERIKTLQKGIATRSTSGDTSIVSPAAEAAIRKSVTREYEKTLASERERNQNSTDSMQKEYAGRVTDVVRDKELVTTRMQKQFATEQAAEQSRFVAHVQDVEMLKNEALRNKEFEAARQSENLNRSYSSMLQRLRREYEDVFQSQRSDAAHKQLSLRQEHEFETKLMQREFAAKQNDLIRDYNKKLADQKLEYETRIDEIKEEAHLQVREMERRSKNALDEQRRTAEQKLAQVEQQHKERERYLTENYEEQLEKVKRSNALLIQKKG